MRNRLPFLVLFACGCGSPPPAAGPPPPPPPEVICRVFVAPDCPISNAYAPEIVRLAAEYGPRGVRFQAVYPVPGITPAAATAHAVAFGYTFPGVADANRAIAREFRATHVPQAVLTVNGTVVYRGRIDDRYPKPGGKRREHPTTHDLADALAAAVRGDPVGVPETPPVGCDIDFDP